LLEHARFLRPAASNALHCVSTFDSAFVRKQSSDIGADHPGAAIHTGSTAHHALGPRHDPKDLEKTRFAQYPDRQPQFYLLRKNHALA